MYIEEIILDGFKSYQKRTTIGKFDPKFNAITGLNGSGKSNILDSICFVLGITNLSQIRINKLEELVYKSGQAGISKASVSIVFNNENKSNSSPLYRDLDKITVTRQIATGGRNRYLMNGNVVKPVDITNFFHSVQLNVNNSHFLIMQGRITKVINMKPKELLSMIEEAAGTRMYETKKQQSLKLIEKKDSKLDEINRMLEEDIIPKLERLKKEKIDYLKWTSINEEIEFYERLNTLHQFNHISQEVQSAEENLEKTKIRLDGIEKEVLVLKDKISDTQQIIQEEENKMKSEWSNPLKDCKTKISEVESNVNLTQVQLNELKLDLEDEENSLSEQLNQKNVLEKKLYSESNFSEKENELSKNFDEINIKLIELKNKLSFSEKTLQGLRTGCDTVTSNEKSLHHSLFDTEKELTNVMVQQKKIKLNIEDIEKTIKSFNAMSNNRSSGRGKISSTEEDYKKLRTHISKLESDIANLKKDAELCENYNLEKKKLKIENDSFEIQLQPLEMLIRTRQFMYKADNQEDLAVQAHVNDPGSLLNPSKFTKTKVKGCLFELINYSDPKYSTALEMAAGGRLYNMVVEDSEVGKRLLNSGLIKKRITLIPLDKIIDPSIPKKVLESARKLTHCTSQDDLKVINAMSVLNYDEEILPAVRYAFGHTLICDNENLAKLITFNPDIAVRTVTLKGDIYDPSGTLSGGSIPNNQRSILSTYKQYNEIKTKISINNHRIEEINKLLSTDLGKATDLYRHSQRQLDINRHQLKLLEEHLSKIKEDSVESKLSKFMSEVEQLKMDLKKLEIKEEELRKNKVRLENEIKNFDSTKDSREEALEKEIEEYKKEIKNISAKYQDLQKVTSSSRIEEEVLKAELEQLKSVIETKNKNISQIKKNIENQNFLLKKLQINLKENKDSLSKLQRDIELSNDTIRDKRAEVRNIEKVISKKQIEMSKISHDLEFLKMDLSQKNKLKHSMFKRFDWLRDETFINQFNIENYEFKACSQKLEELQHEQNSLSKNVNRRILNLYERVNNECNELINKRDIVIKDKDKIEDVINDLDQKKRQALENTWKTVNASFGSIFNTLLPNANAELIPCIDLDTNIENFYEGLEFKVELGGVWKKSLTELSGGQRSILALSLILAMLRFKPAPVYILDEIDSALDLSHTQNIGKMIKNHFPNSQFIIVSLKEGMFNKANTLFRTELINGVSIVHKYENKEYSDENFDNVLDKENIASPDRKLSRARRRIN